jgi:hypothetical protein
LRAIDTYLVDERETNAVAAKGKKQNATAVKEIFMLRWKRDPR